MTEARQYRLALLFLLAVLLPGSPAGAAERRCGWLINPTPNNLSLLDSSGEWTLSLQGSYEAEGIESMPERRERDWVVTNGISYGYGCACLQVETSTEGDDRRVRRVLGGTTEPLSRCQRDRRLPRMPSGRRP
ncbi:MAG: DUF4087 domain-containing protein [Roseomonas mucosa]|nr:DUF4087 domain-containing protein [Roseomonas mucosa]